MTLSDSRRALLERLLRDQGESLPDTPAGPQVTPDIAARHEPFPLTDIQLAYWLGREAATELGGVASHGYQEFVHHDLEPDRYRAAWNRVIARHDMLRAVILPDGRQQILPQVPALEIVCHDLRDLPASEAEACRKTLRRRMSHQVFDPMRWPSMEIAISRMPGGQDIVHVSADALFGDIYSSFVIRHELRQFYDDPSLAPAPLDFSFRDYVMWRQRVEDPRDAAHWTARAAELPPAPQFPPLPTTLAHEAQTGFHRIRFTLPPEAWRGLKRAGQQRGASPSALILTVFSELLGRFGESPRFTLNVTTFSRADIHPQARMIAGDFTETMLLGVDDALSDSLEQRLRRIATRFAEDFEHRGFGGIRTLREINRQRSRDAVGSGRVLMPVVFTSGLGAGDLAQALPAESRDFGQIVHEITQTPQVTLDHQVFEENGALVIQCDHKPSAFPPGFVAQMLDSYRQALQALAGDPALWQCERLVEPPTVQRARRMQANATQADIPPRLLHQPFLDSAARLPGATALVCGEQRLDYATLLAMAAGFAVALYQGDASARVGIAMRDPVRRIAAVLGTAISGRAYVPVEPDWPEARRQLVLQASDADHMLSDLPRPAPSTIRVIADAIPSDTCPPSTGQPSDEAYVIFTSGSTGVPKGVVMSHAAAWNTIAAVNRRIQLSASDRVLGVSALGFDLSVWDIFAPLGVGGTLVLPAAGRERDVPAWIADMRRHRVTVWNSAPALFDLLAGGRDAAPAIHSMRHVMLSGDWIAPQLVRRLLDIAPACSLLAMGGATEAAIWSVAQQVDMIPPAGVAAIPYGRALANQTVHIRDAQMQPVPDWVTGDLYIGGVGLAEGYLGDGEKTAAAFVTDPASGHRLYRTGDLARWRPDAVIEFMGRRDNQVKIGGRRVELGEIEAHLTRHPRIRRAVVRLRPPHGLVAWLQGDDLPVQQVLSASLAAQLPAHMVPARFVAVTDWPVTANGKLDVASLPEPGIAPPDDGTEDGPVTATERRLLDLLRQELGDELDDRPVRVTDGFFDLGATSLSLIRLHRRVSESFGTELAVAELFRLANIRALAARLDGQDDSERLRDAAAGRAERRRDSASRRRAHMRGIPDMQESGQ